MVYSELLPTYRNLRETLTTKKVSWKKAKLTERLAGPKLASGIGTVLILKVFNKHSNVLISKGEPEANILRSPGNELFLNLEDLLQETDSIKDYFQ